MQQLWFNFSAYPHWRNVNHTWRWIRMTAAEREFVTTKPNPPGHAEYLARAAARYPGLPAGAQQAALWASEILGPKAAARYVAHARARWPRRAFQFVMPKQSTRGVCKHDRRELKERLDRYRRHMSNPVQSMAA
jgi:hypothetical protein